MERHKELPQLMRQRNKERDRTCTGKHRYRSSLRALMAATSARNRTGMPFTYYWCHFCHAYHIGHEK
jgi:hypothetical protein